MSDYDNTNRGALFKNERKEQPTHSDYNGTINVDGKEFYLNAWLKESQAGKAYMSLSVKAKDAAKSNGLPASPEISAEDVPF
jgi:hypothetical protein